MADIVKDGALNPIFQETYTAISAVNTTILVSTSGNYTYVGKTMVGQSSSTNLAIWQIMRIYSLGDDTSVTWADGNTLYDNIWDNRASLSYR